PEILFGCACRVNTNNARRAPCARGKSPRASDGPTASWLVAGAAIAAARAAPTQSEAIQPTRRRVTWESARAERWRVASSATNLQFGRYLGLPPSGDG